MTLYAHIVHTLFWLVSIGSRMDFFSSSQCMNQKLNFFLALLFTRCSTSFILFTHDWVRLLFFINLSTKFSSPGPFHQRFSYTRKENVSGRAIGMFESKLESAFFLVILFANYNNQNSLTFTRMPYCYCTENELSQMRHSRTFEFHIFIH